MSQKSLTVGDVTDIIHYLERIKTTADDAEKTRIDKLTEKLKAMRTKA